MKKNPKIVAGHYTFFLFKFDIEFLKVNDKIILKLSILDNFHIGGKDGKQKTSDSKSVWL